MKDEELSGLRARLEVLEKREEEAALRSKDAGNVVQELNAELQAMRETYEVQIAALQRQTQTATKETTDIRAEFQSYKVRAHAALSSAKSTISETRLAELEDSRAKLERERATLIADAEQNAVRLRNLETDLATAFDQITSLEAQLKRQESTARDVAMLKVECEGLGRRLALEKENHEEALKSRDLANSNLVDATRAEARRALSEMEEKLRQKEEEVAAMQAISENLTTDLATARSELDRLRSLTPTRSTAPRRDRDDLMSPISDLPPAGSSFPAPRQSFSGSQPQRSGPSKAPVTFQDLLRIRTDLDESATTPSSTTAQGSMKEKEYLLQIQSLTELLSESEANVQRLVDQEKVCVGCWGGARFACIVADPDLLLTFHVARSDAQDGDTEVGSDGAAAVQREFTLGCANLCSPVYIALLKAVRPSLFVSAHPNNPSPDTNARLKKKSETSVGSALPSLGFTGFF
ncbi:hypothetical protein BDK51DRAFT_47734 [Blyttiomyces helicus]|uniref:Uncharacterized protein n=1 Tax=Blyttiomyces helicus TaxID=388810 RepID=A0A4P9WER3_9FUNG|nr:hypothetical protein BDK51DRAFT_47734 [Blyttiomyces helicus]|eukprot:RKO91221.1 hypothetical protein BDK51DRAFT_47734 [Blyttiomyces helicus]